MHATIVEVDGTGVLLRGPSGSGKSDLALRLIDGGAVLVSDDYVELTKTEDCLLARAPEALAGKLEVRGVGILKVSSVEECAIAIVVELVESEKVDRLPEPEQTEIAGVNVPVVRLAAFEASTAAKIRALVKYGLAQGMNDGN